MGWNDVKFNSDDSLSKGIENPRFYFLPPIISLRTRTLKFWLRLNTEFHSPLLYQGEYLGSSISSREEPQLGSSIVEKFC